jgi:hypothetical protein
MPATRTTFRLAAAWSLQSLLVAVSAWPAVVKNLTGLPSYPHLKDAFMDPVWRTDTLGRWCAHFNATTDDSVLSVETWYRGILAGASETDLSHDPEYGLNANIDGIKLVVGVDWVAVYRYPPHPLTSIDLYRCSPI